MKRLATFVLFGMLLPIGCAEKTPKEPTPEPQETALTETTADISQSTMDVANAFMGAMGKGDMKTMIGLMHDDMVWPEFRRQKPALDRTMVRKRIHFKGFPSGIRRKFQNLEMGTDRWFRQRRYGCVFRANEGAFNPFGPRDQ